MSRARAPSPVWFGAALIVAWGGGVLAFAALLDVPRAGLPAVALIVALTVAAGAATGFVERGAR